MLLSYNLGLMSKNHMATSYRLVRMILPHRSKVCGLEKHRLLDGVEGNQKQIVRTF